MAYHKGFDLVITSMDISLIVGSRIEDRDLGSRDLLNIVMTLYGSKDLGMCMWIPIIDNMYAPVQIHDMLSYIITYRMLSSDGCCTDLSYKGSWH